jgi:hypothetical protein
MSGRRGIDYRIWGRERHCWSSGVAGHPKLHGVEGRPVFGPEVVNREWLQTSCSEPVFGQGGALLLPFKYLRQLVQVLPL